MRIKVLALTTSFLLISNSSVRSSQAATTPSISTQAATVLGQSVSALAGSTSITDVTLTGTAERIAGSDDETGLVSLKATVAGESRMDLTLSSGARSEIRSFDSSSNPIGAWSGPDGVQHAVSFHNLLTDSSWFFPALSLQRLANTSGVVWTYVGQETLNGQTVTHVSFTQASPAGAGTNVAAGMEHLTQMDIYLNSTTLLPIAFSFATHPDDNELLDIPVQIQFSNYQSVSGVQIPFHVQKFLNGILLLDLQVQSATLNSGLSAGAFSVQVAQ
jgi:hypothetical protein